jgi:hypothetical protein
MACVINFFMLPMHRGLTKLACAVAVASLVMLGGAVAASGAADPPTLTVSPTTAMPGVLVTWTAAGFTGCGLVTVVLISPSGASNQVGAFVGAGGSNHVAAPAAPGTYRLNAAGGGCTAGASFVVVASTTTTTAPTTTVPGATTTTVPTATTVPPATTVPEGAPGEPETGPGEPEATTAPVSSTPLPVTG